MVGHVGQVGSQSRPGTSAGVGKIAMCKPHKVSKGLGRWDLDVPFRPVEVSDWELTEGGFRRSEMNGFSWILLDNISSTEGYTS